MKNFLLAILVLCLAPVAGAENFENIRDGQPVPGVGFQGAPPSFLVVVKVEDCHSNSFVGSGVFVSERLVLTAFHNVSSVLDDGEIGIHLSSGKTYYNTRVVHHDEGRCLALIAIAPELDDTFRGRVVEYHRVLGVQENVYTVEECAAMGYNPSDDAFRITFGVNNLKQYGLPGGPKGPVLWGATSPVWQGMSGGPVIDRSGLLVGLIEGKSKDGSESFFVSLKRIQEFLTAYDGPASGRGTRGYDAWAE